MSVDLSGANREIMYVNLTAVGKESKNGFQNFCTAKQTYRDAPLLSNQSKYLVCATRWQVPTSEVPTIEPTSFELWEYNHTNNGGAGYVAPLSYTDFAAHEAVWRGHEEAGTHNQNAHDIFFKRLKLFNIPAAHSVYQWFAQVESMLHENINYRLPDDIESLRH